MAVRLVGACVKWVDLNPQIDQLHGNVEHRRHGAGFSESDLAAVETALRLAEAWDAQAVVACVGPAAADGALRELLACGASRALRVELDDAHGGAPSSAEVARLLAAAWSSPQDRPEVVVCGDASVDRGSGAVPAFLAHELGVAQALGLIEVAAVGRHVEALRRLDGARRERLHVDAPAVLSVEGSVADLRRAPLSATLATRTAPIEVHHVQDVRVAAGDQPRLHPWRPRPRVLPPPRGDRALERIVALTGALVDRTPPRTLELDPPEAAQAILDQLREWGYLPQER
jgi:electron transfer flavoprotein beta subunit